MDNHLTFWAYLIYLPVVSALTYYVAWMLFKNGKIFMLDIFHGKEEIADSTNKLFETGFYLINMGYALVILKIYDQINSGQGLIEILSGKIGGFAIYLGISLFFMLFLFLRGRKLSRANAAHRAEQVGDTSSLPVG